MNVATLRRAIVVPARPGAIALVAVLALGLTLATRAGLFGLPLALMLTSWFFKYGFVLLEHVAHGTPDAPVLDLDHVGVFEQRPFGFALLAAGFAAATGFVAHAAGEVAGTVAGIAGALLAPAVAGVLGVSGRLVEAADPRRLVAFVRGLGADYVVLLGLLLAIAALTVIAAFAGWPLPLAVAAIGYGALVAFAAVGATVFEHRDALGFEATWAPERRQARAAREAASAMDRAVDLAYGAARHGQYGPAWRELAAWLDEQGHALGAYGALADRLAALEDPTLAELLARAYLTRLLARRHGEEGLAEARRRLRARAEFRPTAAAEALQLARLARYSGDRSTARALLADFERHYPGDPLAAAARRLAGELS